MKIKWLGHAAFLVSSDTGVKIVCDPYSLGGGIDYGQIQESADVVTVSHRHHDHDNVADVKGKPDVLDAPGSRDLRGIDFKGIASYHDGVKGKQRGENTIFCFTVDGVKICHLGDLGHELDISQAAEIGNMDILLVPVGGFYTIDAKEATKVCEKLKPRLVIPMHYKTDKCSYPVAGVDDFLKGRKNVRRLGVSEMEIKKEQLPAITETLVLEHAL